MRKTLTGKWLAGIAGTALGLLVFIGTPVTSMAYTQAVGIVSSDTARVRKEPTTDSDAVTGLAKGSTVTITDEVTDSAGSKWYKVSVDGSVGYIRSDLLIKGTASTSSGTAAVVPTETAAQPAALEPTTATPIAETKAYINYESARVRQGASTNHDIVGSALKNTPVTITGEAKASDGKLWYQIKYISSGGREIVGFVRSDLVTVGEPPAQAEPAPEPEAPAEGEAVEENPDDAAAGTEAGTEEPEAPAEEEAPPDVPEETKPDYEMVYRQNESTGEMEWYLFDNINGTMQTLQGLLDAADAGVKLSESNKKMLSTERIIIIVLAVVAAVLAITVTLLLFKIKDLYGDDYDDDEDDDDDEDEDEDDDEEEDEEDDEPAARRGRRSLKAVSGKASRSSSAGRRKVEYDEEEEEDDDEEEEERRPVRTVSRPAAASKTVSASKPAAGSAAAASKPSRKAKNFLIDDDEFEFEFLNMDDRD